jgi:DNA polymerase V
MSAGFPSPAADYTTEELDLNTYLVCNKPATFVFSVKGEYTIKRLFKHMGRVELRPDNPTYLSIKFKDSSELQVQGVVVGVVRRYSSKS